MLPIAQMLGLPSSLVVQDVSRSMAGIFVVVASRAASAYCPRCHTASSSQHSRYTRSAQDLSWSGQTVTLQIRTHKWRCREPTCPQRVFAERLDPLLPRSARMTMRLIHLLRTLTLATSGRSAARLTTHLHPVLSSPTLLRHLMALPDPVPAPARVIGVDEFSFRRGQRGQGHHFGTLIVDLEQHRVLDLLPNRDATTVATWLRAHPSIQVVSRDRAGSFAQAITAALPQAQQVLDRFHLLQNLRDVLERFFLTKREVLRQVRHTHPPAPSVAPSEPSQPSAPEARVARWQYVYQQIHALAAKQVDVTTIARHVQVSRPTVYRYLQMPHPPQVRRMRVQRSIDPFVPYIRQRWQDGVRNAYLIWRELLAQAYTHSVSNVSRFMTQLRREAAQSGITHALPSASPEAVSVPSLVGSAVQVASLVVRQPECRSHSERMYLKRLRATDAAIDQMCDLAEQFCQMVRLRKGELLDNWMAAVQAAPLLPLRTFVRSLLKEGAALWAGLTSPMSQGQTEFDFGIFRPHNRV
nr:ISL3 family transposase [Ktedonobacteraceae bacterium]